ncbi:hypothetical protein SDC9_107451 [bioreactor metagenome]|uniref:Uncharacterized protein n=1 Tax=bioreactor metagenome TaxID=1076179 RepID=A0A645B590_9ZZZZ
MFFMFIKSSVSVRLAIRLALEDIGEHLSPKYAPAIIAPAAILVFTSPLFAMTIRASPTVLTVPSEVPSKKETRLLIINA